VLIACQKPIAFVVFSPNNEYVYVVSAI